MTAWVGQDGRSVEQSYRDMAELALHGTSPSYEQLCLGVAGDPTMIERLVTLPRAKQQPNLLLAATRYLDGPIGSYPEFARWAGDRWDDLAAVMRARTTQTNEAARCTSLLPVLAAIDGPIALFEVGPSAGLCLYPDRYAYRYTTDAGEWLIGDSPVLLDCAASGPVPLPVRMPDIAWRGGLDLNPLDVADPDVRRWLWCLIWPEQSHRFAVLDGALQIAMQDRPHIVAGDLTRDLVSAVAAVPDGMTLVIAHSAVLPYVDGAGRAAFRRSVAEVAARRATVWVSNEAPGVVVDVDTGGRTRFVLARNGEPLALSGQHGATLDWLG